MPRKLLTGHDKIDGDHQVIFDLIEQLASAMKTGKDRHACGVACSEMLAYTRTHFAMEEGLMSHQDYPLAAVHKAEHDRFIERVIDFRNKLAAGSVVVGVEMLTFLLDWWRSHILRTDRALVDALSKDLPMAQVTFSSVTAWATGVSIDVKV
jgi:hemerythrin-like metal-binding protein